MGRFRNFYFQFSSLKHVLINIIQELLMFSWFLILLQWNYCQFILINFINQDQTCLNIYYSFVHYNQLTFFDCYMSTLILVMKILILRLLLNHNIQILEFFPKIPLYTENCVVTFFNILQDSRQQQNIRQDRSKPLLTKGWLENIVKIKNPYGNSTKFFFLSSCICTTDFPKCYYW